MIFELLFSLGFVVLVMFSFYYINMGKRYESDMDKNVLSLFSLGLFFIVVKAVAGVAVLLGFETLLLSSGAIVVYNYLIALCFLLGVIYLKRSDVATE